MERDEDRKMKIRQEDGRLEDILKEHLQLDQVTLISCGEGSAIDAGPGAVDERQQYPGESPPAKRWWSIPATT